MKYAIISDIHGNLDSLLAVLNDAKNYNVDKYIFVGDYCACFP
ncbi:MAG: metallophosphoesterase family protein, partial [Oscillospiraceae bacterium]|nr:metallophosphoesterase family protein [Oscillospiraceae bacterium]